MAYTDIDKPLDFFNTLLYTGNGGTQSITGVGFTQNFTWIKSRSTSQNHYAFDTVRGAQKQLYPSLASAEDTGQSNGLNAFTSDGFNLGTEVGVNGNGATFASWNWKAGTSFTNDASSTSVGTIDSAGSVSTDAGFSITSFTANGSNATIAHGLSAVPQWVILKNRSISKYWAIYHASLGEGKAIFLDTTAAADADNTYWNNTAPTSTTFSFGTNSGNNNGNNMIAYCFAEKQGYSKFGSYKGNGNADGTFVYTGFKPSWFMLKKSSATDPWLIYDNKRSPINQVQANLQANSGNAEVTNTVYLDFLSNGVKFRNTDNDGNLSGGSYIYMAFAENPFVTSTGVPATAR